MWGKFVPAFRVSAVYFSEAGMSRFQMSAWCTFGGRNVARLEGRMSRFQGAAWYSVKGRYGSRSGISEMHFSSLVARRVFMGCKLSYHQVSYAAAPMVSD